MHLSLNLLFSLCLRWTVFLILVAFCAVLTQDVQIFPGALHSLLSHSPFRNKLRDSNSLPPNIISNFITTSDGEQLEVWELSANPNVQKKPYVAITFHGNGESVDGFLDLQLLFSEMGITSYGFDYRGFGNSSGWPSEKGLEQDSDAVWDYVCKKENVSPKNIIVLGYSIGGAPAARIASLHNPNALVLVAAFADIKQLVGENKLFSTLSSFVWYTFPTANYVKSLTSTHLIIIHGALDTLIKPHHSDQLEKAYTGHGKLVRIPSPNTDHNTVFNTERENIKIALESLIFD